MNSDSSGTGPQSRIASVLNNRIVRFLLAGGSAAVVNFLSRFFYSTFLSFGVAVVLAFITGMITAFLLNKIFVFTNSRNTQAQQVVWFVVINLFALLQTWAVSVYLAGWLPQYLPGGPEQTLELAEALAHGAGILIPVFTSYIGHKYLTFRE